MISLIYDMEEGGEMSNINSHQKSIEFIPAICPKCGGNLMVPKDIKVVKCSYCGVDIILRDMNKDVGDQNNIENIKILAKDAVNRRSFSQAIKYYSMVLEKDIECTEAWMGKGYSIGMLSDIYKASFEEGRSLIEKGLGIYESKYEAMIDAIEYRLLVEEAIKYLHNMAYYGEQLISNLSDNIPVFTGNMDADFKLMNAMNEGRKKKSQYEWEIFCLYAYWYHLLKTIGDNDIDFISKLAGLMRDQITIRLADLKLGTSFLGRDGQRLVMSVAKSQAEAILKKWTDLDTDPKMKKRIDDFSSVPKEEEPPKKKSWWSDLFS